MIGNIGDKIAAVAFVVAIVRNAAALCGEGPHEVKSVVACRLELVPEEGTPAAGAAGDGIAEGHDFGGCDGEAEEGEEGREETHCLGFFF